jgi:hypothetical protein
MRAFVIGLRHYSCHEEEAVWLQDCGLDEYRNGKSSKGNGEVVHRRRIGSR